MNGYLPVLMFVLGCAMLVSGITGISHVRRSKARRRHQIVLTLDELLGYANTSRRREACIEVTSKALIVLGGVASFVAYLRL